MKATLPTPIKTYSRGFKSRLKRINYFDSLEAYLEKYYHPEEILSFPDYVKSLADLDGNGEVGSKDKTKSSGKIVERNSNKEKKRYDKLMDDPNTRTGWEQYVDLTVRKNDEELRRIKAQWETSRYYEVASSDAGVDTFKTDSDAALVTQDEKEKAFYQTDVSQKRSIGIVLGLVALVLGYKLISKK